MARGLAYDPRHALNAICPYYTMFPLEYPFQILQKHRESTPIVLDPFCGRGTTIYAAREMGFSAWGIDSSPIAAAIAKAKLASTTLEDVLALANALIHRELKSTPDSSFFKHAFHKNTLKELCSLRDGLLNIETESDAAIVLRAAALGCLHGPMNKAKEPSYFSNQMPRTFSPKPDYAIKYWKNWKLKAPEVRVMEVLKRKLKRISNLSRNSAGTPNQILCSDSRQSKTFKSIDKNFSLIITSPPYYGMKTYTQDQWLRLWFLGGPETVEYLHPQQQLDHNGHDAFTKSMASVWDNVKISQSENLDLYIRFGSIPTVKSNAKAILRSSLEESGGWKIVYTKSASNANVGKRQANQMGLESDPIDEFDFHAIRV